MTFEEAIRKAIKAYRDGKDPDELLKAKGTSLSYDREYFDGLEEEIVGKASKKSKKNKKDEEMEA
jgi:hypothetical protein